MKETPNDPAGERARLEALVLETVAGLGEELGNATLAAPAPGTRLFGGDDGLESIQLVTLIADLEDRLAEATGHDLILADERAMSEKRSPFRRVSSLVDHVLARLADAGDDGAGAAHPADDPTGP